MPQSHALSLLPALLLVISGPGTALAQDSLAVDLAGRVLGADSLPLAGARVVMARKPTLVAITDAAGRFRLQGALLPLAIRPARRDHPGSVPVSDRGFRFLVPWGGTAGSAWFGADGRRRADIREAVPESHLPLAKPAGVPGAGDSLIVSAATYLGRAHAVTSYSGSVGDIALFANVAFRKHAWAAAPSQAGRPAHKALDADSGNASAWGGTAYPAIWTVDLQDDFRIVHIKLRTQPEGNRIYKYKVEASDDGFTWKPVVAKASEVPASETGETHPVEVTAGYLRVTLLSGPAGPSGMLSDFKAYGARLGTSAGPLNLVPWPQGVTPRRGRLSLTRESRILFSDPSLQPVAAALAGDIETLAGFKPPLAAGSAAVMGDVLLSLEAGLAGRWQSRTDIDSLARVSGRNAHNIAMGSANLLQLVSSRGVLPKVRLEDDSRTEYSEIMVDVGRNYIPMGVIRQTVILCRIHKIPYLRLHLSDDQGWTMQSLAYPELGRSNWNFSQSGPYPVYTQAELKGLVQYARDRGVMVIPELEFPGHSAALRRDRPDLFGTSNVCNVASETFYTAAATLLREAADIFSTSPYLHIGADEASLAALLTYPDAQPYLKAHGITTETALWIDHLKRMNAIVKGLGRKTALWEGYFGRPVYQVLEPKSDYLLFEWDGKFYPPLQARADGYKMVNVPWNIAAGVPAAGSNDNAELNYSWNLWLLGSNERNPDQFPAGDSSVVGGSMVNWQMAAHQVIPMLLWSGTAARQERIYNPMAGRTYEDFQARAQAVEKVFNLLMKYVP